MAFKGRVFLGQAGQLGFYYLAVGAIQGAASYFDLSQQSLRGGTLVAIASFSEEAEGTGPTDYVVFATSEGEYIMYGGTDPSNSANWGLVGRYVGAPPIGKKGWFKFRSDVYFITEEGILSLTEIRQMGESQKTTEYLTSKLGRLWDTTIQFNTVHGWGGMIYPRGSAIIINVPNTSSIAGTYIQYVMNTTTFAWTRYTGWNGLCWALIGRRAYFGTNTGKVVLADEGFTDNGTNIIAVCRQAWETFDDNQGMGDADKHFHFATFAMQSDGVPQLAAALNVNFEDDPPSYTTGLLPNVAGAVWDVTAWDTDFWAGTTITQNVTIPVGKIGYTASAWMQAASTASPIRWFATRIILEKTQGVLLQ
jgi:hypothetical protein